ncbi:MAG: di-trans,poly-cis-decaprenylcistransferase [Acidobacteriota bacterium]|nr:di-trans,poly-cis-decaprenylcistransferase [Acidobacteriota bacterium]
MLQRALQIVENEGLHVAIIMDGNGRWAERRGLPRVAGHRAGGQAVRRIVEAAPDFGITSLTLYAFSSDNWRRPAREVWALMRLLHRYLRAETEKCVRHGVRVNFVGRRDRLPPSLRDEIEQVEAVTAGGRSLSLRIAVDYAARDAILRAAEKLRGEAVAEVTRERFAALLGEAVNDCLPARDVDLLIRTGGEQRLSDFLLWESAYAELLFTAKMWPDFDRNDLAATIDEFRARERRFGSLTQLVAG